MKTFSEALRCLESHSGANQHGSVTIVDGGVQVDYEDDTPEMRSIGSLAEEISANLDLRDLMEVSIGVQLGVSESNPSVKIPMYIATKFHEIFLMAFTYGVRVGIEMEKSEETIAV